MEGQQPRGHQDVLALARRKRRVALPLVKVRRCEFRVLHQDAARRGEAARIEARLVDDRLRLTAADSRPGLAPDAGIASIRERLTALYGNKATLNLHRMDHRATEAIIEIPCERLPGDDATTGAPTLPG